MHDAGAIGREELRLAAEPVELGRRGAVARLLLSTRESIVRLALEFLDDFLGECEQVRG